MTTINPETPRERGFKDAPHASPVTPAEDARSVLINRVDWGAVLAGVVVALVTQLILNMIGIGIGAASLDVSGGDNPGATTFSIGAGIWFAVAGILAALAGGFAAGRLSGKPKETTAGWHGVTSWALATLLTIYFVSSSVGGIIGGAYSTVTGAMGNVAGAAGSAAQTATDAAGPDPFAGIAQSIQDALPEGTNTQELQDAAIASVRAAVTGDEAAAEQARTEAAQAISEAQGIPLPEAQAQVDEYQAQYQQTVDEAQAAATEAADTAATAVSTSALLGALGLILGAVAAWFGGRFGAVDPTVTTRARI